MNLSVAARSWLSALTLAAPAAQAQAQPPTAFDQAMDAYVHQRFRDAFDGLARLADDGHGDAARITLLMVAHGPRLFSQRFEITLVQRGKWLDAAVAQAAQRSAE